MVLSEAVAVKPHTCNGVRGQEAPDTHYIIYQHQYALLSQFLPSIKQQLHKILSHVHQDPHVK